jgi:hypothetical protein
MRHLLLALALTGACSEQQLEPGPVKVGTVLTTRDERGAPLKLRIDGITRDPGDEELQLYDVSFRNEAGQWEPYCEPDADGRASALVLQGGWDATGTYLPSDAVTFACTNGAIAKCVRWGYKPWKTVDGVSLAPYHQTCMRVVLADYCGDGSPHTRDGTAINIYDRLGIEKRDANANMVFEAAWSPSGAVYLNEPRRAKAADVVAECPERLSNRTGLGLSEAEIRERYPDALIFTEATPAR